MVDGRQNLTEQVAGEVRQHFGDRVYEHPHPAQRAPLGGALVRQAHPALRRGSKGAKSYLEAAREFLRRHARDEQARHDRQTPRAGARPGRADPRGRAGTHRRRRPHRRMRTSLRRSRAGQPRTHRGDGLLLVGIEEVHPARHQPRKSFDDERLDELAESIRSQGIIQPLVVRRRTGGGLRADRRRAPLAGGPARGPARGAGGGARGGRARGLRDGAGREPAARRPQPHRGGRGLPAPVRRVRLHAGGAGRPGGQGPQHRRQRPAPAEAAAGRCASW